MDGCKPLAEGKAKKKDTLASKKTALQDKTDNIAGFKPIVYTMANEKAGACGC